MKKLLDLLKNAWFRGVIKTLVERIPFANKVFAFVDGYKATIGRILMFIAALLTFLHSSEGFPELFTKFPFMEDISAFYLGVVGYILTELGLQHDVVKELDSEKEGVVESSDV